MSARKKLEEAKFFLDKLQSVSPTSAEFRYYTSACVWALYGSNEHLLYDYAKKYWPDISTNDYLNSEMFESKAKATKNEKAIDFLAWYQEAQGRIGQNKDASVLLKVRHIEAHRASVDYDYLVSLHDAVNVSGTIVITSSTFPPVPAR